MDGDPRFGGGRGGFKRRRDDATPRDPTRVLLASLISFGDHDMPSLQVDEDSVNALVKQLRREAKNNAEAVQTMLLDCAVQLCGKAPLYALLVGMLNVEEPQLVQGFVERLASDINACLQHAGDSMRRARLLLRFAAALVVVGVLQAASVFSAVAGFVATAATIADADGDGRSWQPYADHLVYMALASLPFGGPEMAEGGPEQLQALLEATDAYMARRPRATQPSLRPFSAAIKDDDPLAESDNGGASFLPEVVAAIRAAVEAGQWELESIPRVHLALEATLASAQDVHQLPKVEVPTKPPVDIPQDASPTLAGALMLRAFPPRGIIRFLDEQHTGAGRPPVERLVAEDYILDMVAWFEGDRVECAKRLALALPLPYPYEPLLCEVLFGQMLRIPRPHFKPVMYAALMVDLCKLQKLVPRAMSACMRESFARMNVMDPMLRGRLAEWLAYHLSNFDYVWPWSKWQHVLEAPAFDGQRRFCVAVMNRLVRLSYWDRIQAVLPEEFRPLLPPKPEVNALPAADDASAAETDIEGLWAARALVKVKEKLSDVQMDAWVAENSLEEVLGGKLGVLRMLARCLLVAGAKSYTHMAIALERYFGPLDVLVQDTGLEGEIALVAAAAKVWSRNPQRAVMAVDRLMAQRLASGEAIVTWVFQSEGVRSISDESRCGMAWDILYAAVDKTTARVQDAVEEVAAGRAHVEHAKAAVAAGAGTEEVVVDAEQALPAKEAYLALTTSQQQAALLQVLRCFVDMLCEGGSSGRAPMVVGDDTALDANAGEVTALHDYTLATLKSFMRRYNVEVAQIADQVEATVLVAPAITPEVKEAIQGQLCL